MYYFTRTVSFTNVPEMLAVRVPADNRYRLYVNGKFIGFGPALGDIKHWKYDTYDVAEHLREGDNTIAAMVTNFGKHRGAAQISAGTAFVLECDSDARLNTDSSWRVTKDPGYSPVEIKNGIHVRGGFIAPACDRIDGRLRMWNWHEAGFDEGDWPLARELDSAVPAGADGDTPWRLIARDIPFLESRPDPAMQVVRAAGIDAKDISTGDGLSFTVPANTKAILLLDNRYLTTGFPELMVSGGKDATIIITYAESLYEPGQRDASGNLIDEGKGKGNRNETEGKEMLGCYDVFIVDGGAERLYRPLWFRTYRYIRMEIETAAQPLIVERYRGVFTAYPFEENAAFECGDKTLEQVWDVGWRTARLCAWETYMDCPYYEQLQYVGDTRIQALVSLYVSGDDRLMRNAIAQFYYSRTAEGLTSSAYPAQKASIIPPYSLFWVGMIHDFWMHRQDDDFVKSYLPAAAEVLAWHERYADPCTGMLTAMPHWNFVDWPAEWPWDPQRGTGGMPAGAETGNSSILTLQYVYALQQAAELFEAYRMGEDAIRCRGLAERLGEGTYELCWDPNVKLLADTPVKREFSQHANVLAVLTGIVPLREQGALMERVINNKKLIQCTMYYRFYLNRALDKAGRGDLYLQTLDLWEDMLDLGLTTFAEKSDPTRSDCHGWSASPNYEFLATVCGIRPASAGFQSVCIGPNLGDLTNVKGRMPHPLGTISVDYKVYADRYRIKIILPERLAGSFELFGRTYALGPGRNFFNIYR